MTSDTSTLGRRLVPLVGRVNAIIPLARRGGSALAVTASGRYVLKEVPADRDMEEYSRPFAAASDTGLRPPELIGFLDPMTVPGVRSARCRPPPEAEQAFLVMEYLPGSGVSEWSDHDVASAGTWLAAAVAAGGPVAVPTGVRPLEVLWLDRLRSGGGGHDAIERAIAGIEAGGVPTPCALAHGDAALSNVVRGPGGDFRLVDWIEIGWAGRDFDRGWMEAQRRIGVPLPPTGGPFPRAHTVLGLARMLLRIRTGTAVSAEREVAIVRALNELLEEDGS